jgi:hypothetical protein
LQVIILKPQLSSKTAMANKYQTDFSEFRADSTLQGEPEVLAALAKFDKVTGQKTGQKKNP